MWTLTKNATAQSTAQTEVTKIHRWPDVSQHAMAQVRDNTKSASSKGLNKCVQYKIIPFNLDLSDLLQTQPCVIFCYIVLYSVILFYFRWKHRNKIPPAFPLPGVRRCLSMAVFSLIDFLIYVSALFSLFVLNKIRNVISDKLTICMTTQSS